MAKKQRNGIRRVVRRYAFKGVLELNAPADEIIKSFTKRERARERGWEGVRAESRRILCSFHPHPNPPRRSGCSQIFLALDSSRRFANPLPRMGGGRQRKKGKRTKRQNKFADRGRIGGTAGSGIPWNPITPLLPVRNDCPSSQLTPVILPTPPRRPF